MAIKRKKYKSRREKYERDKRNFLLIFSFAMIALVVLLIKNRRLVSDWFILNFY